jgi:phosphoribosylaminoimidazolecarboxamide formyltransferase / IMP cyclohydrolase
LATRFALLSVSDKTGIVDFARGLVGQGFTLLSTGGTAKEIRAAGLPVTEVSAHTGQPEIMEGRVKTLHPRVHGGILGLRDRHAAEAREHSIEWIDVVAVNLYPFEATVARGAAFHEVIENIDIGGPSMVRSAAKNHEHVAVVVDPADYARVLAGLEAGGPDLATRRELALRAYAHTARYDAVISNWLADQIHPESRVERAIPLVLSQDMRYGENPHQRAAFYVASGEGGRALGRAKQHQGKQLSFNNVADLDAALRVAFDFAAPACTIIKHMNPCGTAVHVDGPAAAFELALSADPVSAFGGILAFNRPLGGDDVKAIRNAKTLFEVLAAPGFSPEALERLKGRENLRVMELPADWADSRPAGQDARRVMGGWLLQDWDVGGEPGWTVATERAPTAHEESALRFAWAVCRHVKSNAIVLARKEGQGFVSNGVGAGQMSRVDSVEIAVKKATRPVAGCVLASDAFFPFPDGVEAAVKAGVSAIMQPGGSVKDADVVGAANAAGAAMVFTGMRHFRH